MKKHVTIIAEAGVNHNGDLQKAFKLIEVAAESGADFIKFQTFKADTLATKAAGKAEYQSTNLGDKERTQHEMLSSLELSDQDHSELIKKCRKNGIRFLSTAFDIAGIDYLDKLGLPFFKSPSGEITNLPYLKQLAQKGKPVLLSTGMADLQEVIEAVEVLYTFGLSKDQITVLHCTTDYPTSMKDVNLKAMHTIASELNVKVGYSDHTLGIEVPVAAVAMGAVVIEKHFTLDRSLPGPDHRASLEPDELGEMVRSIRNVEEALSGGGVKKPTPKELENRTAARKSVHLAKAVKKGKRLERDDLTVLRPGDGISPMQIEEVIGKVLNRKGSRHDQLNWGDLI